MSGTEDLDNLLSRLKKEVGPLPPELPQDVLRQRDMVARLHLPAARSERFLRQARPEAQRESQRGSPAVTSAWSENKEIMLFGALTSLIAILGGVLSGIDYLVLIGAVVFMLFSFMLLLYLFGHYLNSRRSGQEEPGLAERVDALSRKIEMLSSKAVSGPGAAYSHSVPEKERELEHKVEELRVLVKTLAKSVEQQ